MLSGRIFLKNIGSRRYKNLGLEIKTVGIFFDAQTRADEICRQCDARVAR